EECAYRAESGEAGYSIDQMADDVIVEEVARLPRTPQGSWDACFIAHAPADLAALVAVVREVAALHRRRVERPNAGCLQCGQIWPCPTAAAVQKLGEALSLAPPATPPPATPAAPAAADRAGGSSRASEPSTGTGPPQRPDSARVSIP